MRAFSVKKVNRILIPTSSTDGAVPDHGRSDGDPWPSDCDHCGSDDFRCMNSLSMMSDRKWNGRLVAGLKRIVSGVYRICVGLWWVIWQFVAGSDRICSGFVAECSGIVADLRRIVANCCGIVIDVAGM